MKNDKHKNRTAQQRFHILPIIMFVVVACAFYFGSHNFRYSEWNVVAEFVDESASRVAEGNTKRQIWLLILAAFGSLLALKYHFNHHGLLWSKLGRMLLALFLLMFLSYFWSVDPNLTQRRLLAFVTIAIGALGCSKSVSMRQLLNLIFAVCFVYLGIGIVAELTLNTFRPFDGFYRFCGTMHPNSQALNCGLLVLSGLTLSNNTEKRWNIYSIGVVLGVLFLILTKSRMGLASAMIGMVVYLNLVTSKTKMVGYIVGGIVAVLSLFLVLGDLFLPMAQEAVLLGRQADEAGGRDLAGRIPLFQECLRYVVERPVVGYGYGAFWSADRIEELSYAVGWPTAGAHSVYMDITLELGVVGLILWLGICLAAFRRARQKWFAIGDPGYAFFCGFVVMILMNGLLESIFLAGGFLLFVGLTVFLRLAYARGEQALVSGNSGVGAVLRDTSPR
jgi:O-antigen ligase